MRFTMVAVAAGLVLGLATGGRPRYLADKRVAGWPLLVAGLVLQASVNRLPGGLSLSALVASYALLLLFGLVNLRLVGMSIVLVGLALNAFTITLNGGMSVRVSAVVAARAAPPDKLAHIRVVGKHHLARPSDRLTILSDVIPVRPLHEVLSFGDIIMSVGVADVLANMLRPARPDRGAGDTPGPDPDRAAGIDPACPAEGGGRGEEGAQNQPEPSEGESRR